MKRSVLTIAAALLLVPSVAGAQALSDLVPIWLAQNGKTAAVGDWSTCIPPGEQDQVCIWDVSRLGAQPTAQQLQTLAPAWQAMQQAQQLPAILKAGLAVTWTGVPALSGTYGVDPTAQMNIDSQIASILTNGTFTNKQATRVWHDANSLPHTLTVPQFQALATAIGAYVDDVLTTYGTLLSGQAASWPAATATIP